MDWKTPNIDIAWYDAIDDSSMVYRHEGDWTITAGTTANEGGRHYITGKFTIEENATVSILHNTGGTTGEYGFLEIIANEIEIAGTIDGKGKGCYGGDGGDGASSEGCSSRSAEAGENGVGLTGAISDDLGGIVTGANYGTGGAVQGVGLNGGYNSLSGNSEGINLQQAGFYTTGNTRHYPDWEEYIVRVKDEALRQHLFMGGGGGGGGGGNRKGGGFAGISREGCSWVANPSTRHLGGGGGGAGGSGGAYVKLFGIKSIVISDTAKIDVRGISNGGDGTSGGVYTNSWDRYANDGGTWFNISRDYPPLATTFCAIGNGLGGSKTTTGRSAGGKKAYMSFWGDGGLNCVSEGDGETYGWDQPCHGNLTPTRQTATVYPGNNGANGGSGSAGGIVLYSYGPIQFPSYDEKEDVFDLRTNNEVEDDLPVGGFGPVGGTLKIFYTSPIDESTISEDHYGVLYTELIYKGYSPSGVEVSPLTASELSGAFQVDWNEGEIWIPEGIEDSVVHTGFKVFRYIDTSMMQTSIWPEIGYAGATNQDSHPQWTLITTDDFPDGFIPHEDFIGGTGVVSDPYEYSIIDDLEGINTATKYSIFRTKQKILYKVVAYFTIFDIPLQPDPVVAYPRWTNPHTDLLLEGIESTPRIYQYIDELNSWNSQIISTSSGVSGYDNLFVKSEGQTYWGSFEVSSWDWGWGDKIQDVGGLINDGSQGLYTDSIYSSKFATRIDPIIQTAARNYKYPEYYYYHDPSINGKSNNRQYGWPGEAAAPYTASVTGNPNPNVYIADIAAYTSSDIYDYLYTPLVIETSGDRPWPYTEDNNTVDVFERWPSAIFYVDVFDVPSLRAGTGENKDYEEGANISTPKWSNSRIVSGIAPLSAIFHDVTIAHTWPVYKWDLDYTKGHILYSSTVTPVISTTTITTICNGCITGVAAGPCTDCNDPSYTARDKQIIRGWRDTSTPYILFDDFIYMLPGVYTPTLTATASASNTADEAYRSIYAFSYPGTSCFVWLSAGSYAAYPEDECPDTNYDTPTAYVPVRITLQDRSLSGYWPVSSWYWELKDGFDRTVVSNICSVVGNNDQFRHEIIHDWKWHTQTSDYNIGTVDNNIENVCLTINGSAASWYVSAFSNVGLTLNDMLVDITRCRHLKLLEKAPLAEFVTVTSKCSTVETTFTSDSAISAQDVTAYTNGNYVSGYAPYLNVTFMDNSSAQSYPISSYHWNFGDYYSNAQNESAINVTTNELLSGWYDTPNSFERDVYPAWTTTQTSHEVNHIYRLPGCYDVSLTVEASTTETTGYHQKVGLVYVEEILPSAATCIIQSATSIGDWGTDVLYGYAPLTIYFNATGIIPGSFPIGQIIWEFSDGDSITIDSNEDGCDPRWIDLGDGPGVIKHIFRRPLVTDDKTFQIYVSAITEETYRLISCSAEVGPVYLPQINSENLHLIKNRMYNTNNELLYVIENTQTAQTYNVLFGLSACEVPTTVTTTTGPTCIDIGYITNVISCTSFSD